ncbi:MAG: class I SAM-dependent methyltransferase [Deltaproteobacteria bacterium]|nr:class I SAM-dependent methyltransferase [Deltaproteobacteria bacterium]
MVGPRVEETGQGIQEAFHVGIYDTMMRRMRDKGWLETGLIVKAGIVHGLVLEVGSGPGYLGLEWLKKTSGTRLKAVEISPAMIEVARRNAAEYGFRDRVEYVPGDATKMPFDDHTFDGVFTNGSLHEWADPKRVFNEVHRVLQPGGRYCISDLRRDMNPLVRWFMQAVTKPKEIRFGLISSIRAAYVVEEIRTILGESRLGGSKVKSKAMGLVITGTKPA